MENSHKMAGMTKNKRDLTPEQRAVAARIKSYWLKRKSQKGMTQEVAAGLIKMSQGDFSKYLNGGQPVTLEILLRFAKLLGVKASVLGYEIVTPYTDGIDDVQTLVEGHALAPKQLQGQDLKNWHRLNQLMPALDSSDLQWFADIVELRINQQNGHDVATGMRDRGKRTPKLAPIPNDPPQKLE